MSMYGLYQPYKTNRPLTSSEKRNAIKKYVVGDVKLLNCGETIIKMNSTFLETTDKCYKKKGIDNYWWVMVSIAILLPALIGIGRGFQLIQSEGYMPLVRVIIFGIFCLGVFLFTGSIVLKEWFRWTHYPIRFNRKNKTVYVFKENGSVLSVPWNDIYFTQDKEPGPLREWCIRGHILDIDGETVLETFSLGICESKKSLPEYWEFIRCYMEENVVSDLAELVVLCPPVENRREGYLFGLQNMLYMESRLEWLFLPFLLPFFLPASVCRYIASQTSKIPSWPQDIQEACQPDIDDSINVSADNNPQQMWKLVFANQSLDVWQEKYDRMDAANKRIHEMLKNKNKIL